MLDVEAFLESRYPDFWHRRPHLARPLARALRLLFHEREFRQFEAQWPHLTGFDFVEQVLDHFQFRYAVRDDERERIPARGRVVVVANHPIGSRDGLALLRLVRSVRRDVKVVANEVLSTITPLIPLLLPVDNLGGHTERRRLEAIRRHLEGDGALILFPAGEVSRLGFKGIRDGRWRSGFLRLAASVDAPIVPVHVDGRNSALFYALSFLARPLSTLWLVREMFKQAKNCVDVRIGEPIRPATLASTGLSLAEQAELFRRHVYRIGRNRPGILPSEAAIAHPEDRALLREELSDCPVLGHTPDGMRIYLFHHRPDSAVMREVGRLREIAFRAVGEGTGQRRDLDRFDPHCEHLLL